jgi:hypothetical protein
LQKQSVLANLIMASSQTVRCKAMTTRRAMTILGFPLSQTFEETEISGKIWVTRGRCYDHNFQRFFPIFGETIGLFGENILKIITSVPDYRNPGSLQTTSQEENLSKTFKERKTGKVCIIDIYVVYLCHRNHTSRSRIVLFFGRKNFR